MLHQLQIRPYYRERKKKSAEVGAPLKDLIDMHGSELNYSHEKISLAHVGETLRNQMLDSQVTMELPTTGLQDG